MAVDLDIIIPVYNESALIQATLSAVASHIQTAHRILIVYDFEGDSTLPAVRRYCASHPDAEITLLLNDDAPGVLHAIRKGFKAAQSEAVLVVMGDLSDDLTIVDGMYARLREGADLVCGSRYMPGGQHIGGPWLKKTLSRLAGISLHQLVGIPTHDISNSFKMYRKQLLTEIDLESTGGFEIGLELLVKAWTKGYRIAEIPSVWQDRPAGESKFKLWAWLPHYLHWYIYALRHRNEARDSRRD